MNGENSRRRRRRRRLSSVIQVLSFLASSESMLYTHVCQTDCAIEPPAGFRTHEDSQYTLVICVRVCLCLCDCVSLYVDGESSLCFTGTVIQRLCLEFTVRGFRKLC